MTGLEARDFVLSQISEHDPDSTHKVIKLSTELAMDLLKLTPHEIGKFAEVMLAEGLGALLNNKLYGYKVEIDRKQEGHVVEFGV